jgi:CDGSH-type Zn-finger protein/uncharacterized Fe-S cluster protein YjdI
MYGLMLRLLGHAYATPRDNPEKVAAVETAVGLMRALGALAERAARLPAGPSNAHCHAGVSFVALRDASTLPAGVSARRFFNERLTQLAQAAATLDVGGDERTHMAAAILGKLAQRAATSYAPAAPPAAPPAAAPAPAASPSAAASPTRTLRDGIEEVETEEITLVYEGKRCIHARNCVTWGPSVFLANVQGPWIHPETMDVERVAELAHVCPSGAIRYRRKDGRPEEPVPPVNLVALRESGPYAFRGDLRIDGEAIGFRATLCRCGASKNKPFCDGSHHEVNFSASGEPPTGTQTDMLALRNGPLEIAPQTNGPLQIRGNLEITAGTGRMVARLTSTRLCRCGGSSTKPFCDGTHAKIGFRDD